MRMIKDELVVTVPLLALLLSVSLAVGCGDDDGGDPPDEDASTATDAAQDEPTDTGTVASPTDTGPTATATAECGDMTCTRELDLFGFITLAPCCVMEGVDSDGNTVPACGAGMGADCGQFDAPGENDGQCPMTTVTLMIIGDVDWEGCCQPNGECGVINSVIPDYGCTNREALPAMFGGPLDAISCIPGAGVDGGAEDGGS